MWVYAQIYPSGTEQNPENVEFIDCLIDMGDLPVTSVIWVNGVGIRVDPGSIHAMVGPTGMGSGMPERFVDVGPAVLEDGAMSVPEALRRLEECAFVRILQAVKVL